jgi:hypothetical protein
MAVATYSRKKGTFAYGRHTTPRQTTDLFPTMPISILGVLLSVSAVLPARAEQGTTAGLVYFSAKGEAKNYKPALTLWNGTFLGVSITDERKGPLHSSAWDCTGEVVIQDGKSHSANGFCLVTDPDGDTINLLWVRTDVPGGLAEPKTKGTYLSGTGKYSGIQGYYTFGCKLNGTLCNITGGEYKIP